MDRHRILSPREWFEPGELLVLLALVVFIVGAIVITGGH